MTQIKLRVILLRNVVGVLISFLEIYDFEGHVSAQKLVFALQTSCVLVIPRTWLS